MITIDKRFGDIYSIFTHCTNLAKQCGTEVKFEFNGCNFVVSPFSVWNESSYKTIMNSVTNGTQEVVYL